MRRSTIDGYVSVNDRSSIEITKLIRERVGQIAQPVHACLTAPIATGQDFSARIFTPRKNRAANESRGLRIRGGKPLAGRIAVRGAKNTLPKQIVASLLTNEKCVLRNVAEIRDVQIISEMLQALGGTVESPQEGVLEISTSAISPKCLPELLAFEGVSRIPILLCGPLLHRFGEAEIPKLGGCELNGSTGRPIDFHLAALQQLGATVKECEGRVSVTGHQIYGSDIRLKFPSVGATEQILLTAVLARGTTHIANASLEPEVLDLIDLLTNMGANIHWTNYRDIKIQGVNRLAGYDYTSMVDRSELGSWACAAAATGGKIVIEGACLEGMEPFIDKFQKAGGEVLQGASDVTFGRSESGLRPVDIETGPHPAFRTDWQPPFSVLLTQGSGVSTIHETVFRDRLGYTVSMSRLGADIETRDHCVGSSICRFGDARCVHSAIIRGGCRLKGTNISISDLRGGFACLIAALIAEGETVVRHTEWLDKGYEHIAEKLAHLGASCISE